MVQRTSKRPRSQAPIGVFLATTTILFFLSLSAADSIGFVPCYLDDTSCAPAVTLTDLPQLGESTDTPLAPAVVAAPSVLPTRITISSIGLDLPVQNPYTRDLTALDALLQKGPARHPDSARLGEAGNTIIFGHSSHLPIVHNKMYRAFNKLPTLMSGDTIVVTGADGISYIYSVDSVISAKAGEYTDNFLSNPSRKLYIITCDTLTGKSARYVLTASFVGTD